MFLPACIIPSTVKPASKLAAFALAIFLLGTGCAKRVATTTTTASAASNRSGKSTRVTSGAAVLWRRHHDLNPTRREEVERITLRIVGACFVALALYILYDAGKALSFHEAPDRSIPGILIAALSVLVMPLLARAKRRIAIKISSATMHADSRQTDFCMYLSAILLGGLLVNALFGWWWADPVAALVMVPIIAKEGLESLKGKACGCEGACGLNEILSRMRWPVRHRR